MCDRVARPFSMSEENEMKCLRVLLASATIVVVAASAGWAQVGSDVKRLKGPTDDEQPPQTQAECEAAGMKWNEDAKKCEAK